jgi:hypothetical protein
MANVRRGAGAVQGADRWRSGSLAAKEVRNFLRNALLHRLVAVEEDPAVGGVVPAPVERAQGIGGEVVDCPRVPARVPTERRVGEERAQRPLARHGLGAGVRAFHLVEDDPRERGPAVHLFQAPPLLAEGLVAQQGEEHRVAVYVEEVQQVPRRAARGRIDGAVGEREGVQEGRHAAAHQHGERLAQREAPGARERGVLEDVRRPGVVEGGRGEREREQVLGVRGREVEHLAPGGRVAEHAGPAPVLVHRALVELEESVN